MPQEAFILFDCAPDGLDQDLRAAGVDPAKARVAVRSDLDFNGRTGETWVLVTADAVLAAMPLQPAGKRVIGPYPLHRIEKVRVFRGVGSSFLQVRTQSLFLDLARFSNTRRELFNRLRNLIEEAAAGKNPALDILKQRDPWFCASCNLALPARDAACPRCARQGGLLVRTLSLMRPYAGYVAVLLTMMLFGVAFDLVPPYLTRILVDDVLTSQKRTYMLVWLVLALAGTSLLRAALNILIGRATTTIGTRITFDLRARLHRKLADLSVDFHDRTSSGSLITRLLSDVEYFHGFIHQVTQGFFVNILMVFGVGFMLFRLNTVLACYVLIPIPLVMLGTWFFWHKIYPRYFRYWDSQSKMASLLSGMLAGIRTVKAFSQEDREHERFSSVAQASRQARRSVDQGAATFYPIFGYVFGLGGLIIWYAGGRSVLEQHITLGTLMAFLGYLGMFYSPISALTMFSNWLTGFLTAGQRIFEVLDTSVSLQDPAQPRQLAQVKGRIELRDVTFGYDPYQPVLKNISMTVEPGQTVGIVGKSGSGKTTLINLVCRFYDPQQGQVLFDGHDVRELARSDLRRHVGLVLQEPFLFRATIAENIAYGVPESDPRRILNAAHAANCHPFILRQPAGYDTRLGERGAGLSGGERQRISIARALLCDPAVLILDEATSNVDTESEQQIQKALAVMTRSRTTIIIAHRLSTLKNADVIYVLDEGRIKEHGNHEELMALGGTYHNLVTIQTQLTRIEQ